MQAGFDASKAVALAIDYCIEHDILADVLRKNRGEVTDMILTVYNEKLHNKTLREEGRTEGLAEGRRAGLAEGRETTLRKINDLNNRLLEDGRMEDLKRSLKDNKFQEALLKEYGLDDSDDLFL